jgi:hypothetical protein
MNFPDKNDYDICKNIIENDDLLLSSNLNQNEFDIDLFAIMQSASYPSETNADGPRFESNQLEINSSQLIVSDNFDEKSQSTDQLSLNDEIIGK